MYKQIKSMWQLCRWYLNDADKNNSNCDLHLFLYLFNDKLKSNF